VPKTYLEYTSRRVLTTEWLEGEKLSQVGGVLRG
jgi:aarF domain-containing kinase